MVQSYKEQATKLAGQIAFLKMYSTQSAQTTARDAVQIFGGRGITKSGMGRFIEHVSLFRAVPLLVPFHFSYLIQPYTDIRCGRCSRGAGLSNGAKI